MEKKYTEQKLRPCIVRDSAALFHGWAKRAEIIPPSPMRGGHNGGTIEYTIGIVEYEDGRIAEVHPRDIRFTDVE